MCYMFRFSLSLSLPPPPKFRYFVLYKLPGLMFLDSRQVTAKERREAKRVGEFTKVIRPTDDVVRDTIAV